MKPDSSPSPGPEPVEVHGDAAHLRPAGDSTHRIWRYLPSPGLEDLVRRYWVPVWAVPPGAVSIQRVLQYPVALMVIRPDGAQFSGVTSGLSAVELAGRGYALGVMLQPAAGTLMTRCSMSEWTDRTADLESVLGVAAVDVVDRVHATMASAPSDPAAHLSAIEEIESLMRAHLPVDEEGLLVNRIVELVEDDPSIVRVAELCEQVGSSERSLQRLCARRLGIGPKWLIRRRRLHEAAAALRGGTEPIAVTAARLGYSDQAHLTRDLRAVTGLTPVQLGRFLAGDYAGE